MNSVFPTKYCQNVFEVNLSLLEKNVEEIRKLVAPSQVAVAIKSNAYGHGFLEIAKKLDSIDIAMLCVSSADEALALRSCGIASQILILSEPPKSAIQQCVKNDISFTVYTQAIIDEIVKTSSSDKQSKVHLKVNTGMNRVGCGTGDAVALAKSLKNSPSLDFEGIATHFANADDLITESSQSQLKLFESVLDELEVLDLLPEIIHSANTPAALYLPESRFSMVRVGLGAYGLYPNLEKEKTVELEPIAELKSKVSFVKKIMPGQSVSYGWKYTATKETTIATIPIGYGDGVPRNLGLVGANVVISGRLCPIVGAVTMDQLMVDTQDLDVEIGDEVMLIGRYEGGEISFWDWAKSLDTIPYELMCQLSDRLKREYV